MNFASFWWNRFSELYNSLDNIICKKINKSTVIECISVININKEHFSKIIFKSTGSKALFRSRITSTTNLLLSISLFHFPIVYCNDVSQECCGLKSDWFAIKILLSFKYFLAVDKPPILIIFLNTWKNIDRMKFWCLAGIWQFLNWYNNTCF